MLWSLRLKAVERGIWRFAELRRMLADAGLELSLGKMSALWTGTPTTIRLNDLDVICHVLSCEPSDLLVREPDKVLARKPAKEKVAGASDAPPTVKPRPGNPRSTPHSIRTAPGIGSRYRAPRTCFACGVNRAAWTWPRVECCYDCMPGGPFTPPPNPHLFVTQNTAPRLNAPGHTFPW